MPLEYLTVATLAEVAPGDVKGVTPATGCHIALCNVNGTLYAIDDACTHAGGMMQFGELEGEIIECPLHGARFNIRTGEVVEPPAKEPLATYPVRVNGDQIEVRIEV